MSTTPTRRSFLRDLGLGAAALPFVLNLPSLGFANQTRRKQRLVVLFSPNGVVPGAFWPAEVGEKFTLKESLTPLKPFSIQPDFLRPGQNQNPRATFLVDQTVRPLVSLFTIEETIVILTS